MSHDVEEGWKPIQGKKPKQRGGAFDGRNGCGGKMRKDEWLMPSVFKHTN
jgi:hypothetical protein